MLRSKRNPGTGVPGCAMVGVLGLRPVRAVGAWVNATGLFADAARVEPWFAGAGEGRQGRPWTSMMRAVRRLKDKRAAPVLRILDTGPATRLGGLI